MLSVLVVGSNLSIGSVGNDEYAPSNPVCNTLKSCPPKIMPLVKKYQPNVS